MDWDRIRASLTCFLRNSCKYVAKKVAGDQDGFRMFFALLRAIRSSVRLLGERGPRDWLVDHVDPQAGEDNQELDETSRQVFSIAMSSYKTLPLLLNPVKDQETLEEAFNGLDFTVQTAKDVEKTCLEELFEKFLNDSLSKKTYVVVLHVACHGEEQGGHLVLKLTDGTDFYLDDLLVRLNKRLDTLVRQASQTDPVKDVAVFVLWDACRTHNGAKLHLPKRVTAAKTTRERQQVMMYSCMNGGSSADGQGQSTNSPFTAALKELLDEKIPWNVLEFQEHLNSKVKSATKGRQAVESSGETTNLSMRYDCFVDLITCNKLRLGQQRFRRLKAKQGNPKAFARLVSLWKVEVPYKPTDTPEDFLRSMRESQQEELLKLRAQWVDKMATAVQAKEDAEEQARVAENKRADAQKKVSEAKQTRQERRARKCSASFWSPRPWKPKCNAKLREILGHKLSSLKQRIVTSRVGASAKSCEQVGSRNMAPCTAHGFLPRGSRQYPVLKLTVR